MATEQRLIDANGLLRVFEPQAWDSVYIQTDTVITEIKTAPTVDAVEVVHGHWGYLPNGDVRCINCGFEWFPVCQECGVTPYNTNYCPNCGARMDLED